eukprot:g17564.t1
MEEEFLEYILDRFLDQYEGEPTREQAILDWVLCNEKGVIANLAVQDPLGMSDHNMIGFFIKLESEIVDSETSVLNHNKGNYEDMRHELALIDWDAARPAELFQQLLFLFFIYSIFSSFGFYLARKQT